MFLKSYCSVIMLSNNDCTKELNISITDSILQVKMNFSIEAVTAPITLQLFLS